MQLLKSVVKKMLMVPGADRLVEKATSPFVQLHWFCRFQKWSGEHRERLLSNPHKRHFDYENRYDLYRELVGREGLDLRVTYLEFGVAGGDSMKWWVKNNSHPQSLFYGFDTFTGFPERWGHLPEGTFSTAGRIPDIPDQRVRFIAGLFQETLIPFIDNTPIDGRKILHLDADLYSSTLYVLTTLHRYLHPGDVLLFDDFTSIDHEFRAFHEYRQSFRCRYEVLLGVNGFMQVAMKMA